jgi:hypothetical protein
MTLKLTIINKIINYKIEAVIDNSKKLTPIIHFLRMRKGLNQLQIPMKKAHNLHGIIKFLTKKERLRVPRKHLNCILRIT